MAATGCTVDAANRLAYQPRSNTETSARHATQAKLRVVSSGNSAAPSAGAPPPSLAPDDSPSAALPPDPAESLRLPAADLLRDARAATGAIDRALRQEQPRRGIRAPVVTTQMKLERGIAHAAEMAPTKWYQAPKVQEIIDPGGYGRRRDRVVGSRGTYCVTHESNHAPDGIDSMRHGIKPKITNCEATEEPAKAQDWDAGWKQLGK